MINKYSTYFETSISEDINIKLFKQIQRLNLCKEETTFNNKFNKYELFLLHLINDYHLAYEKSKDEEKDFRSNTLESLGKRNDNRKKRFDKNEEIQRDKSKTIKERLTASYENIILDLFIKRKRKLANLILAYTFINKERNYLIQKSIFLKTKLLETIYEAHNDALKLFEYTYISRAKIANSCLICVYAYLTKVAKVDDNIAFKFTDEIRKLLFKEDSVQKLIKKYLDSQIYCDGIYNSTPIFHWYTPKDKDYYKDEDLNEFLESINLVQKDTGILKDIIFRLFTSKSKISIKNIEDSLSKKEILEQTILSLCEDYLKSPNKLTKLLSKNGKKGLKYYLSYPFKAICTIFLYLNTKSTH